MKDHEEELWIKRCRQGDTNAFAHLVKSHQQRIFGLCWQFLREVQAARDASADIFCKAFRHLDRYEQGRSFSAWLMGIAGKHLLQMKRSDRRSGIIQDLSDLDLAMEGPTPEEWLTREMDRQRVSDALGRLPDHYRLVLHLRYFEDMAYEELARQLDMPKNTVGSLILRAKALLRDELLCDERQA